MPLLVASIVSLALLVCARAQTVVEPSQLDPGARCEPFALSNVNCQGAIPPGARVYLNSSMTQASADAFASTQATLIAVVSNLDSKCASALYPWMCSLVFRPCTWQNFSTGSGIQGFALPNLTCQALCDDVNSVCAAVSLQFNQPPQLCDPSLSYNFTDYGAGIFAPSCFMGWTDSGNGTACPTQCLRPDFQDPENCCKLRCPLGKAIFGEEKFRSLYLTLTSIAYIAFFATLITVILFATNPVARRFPGVLIIAQGIALLLECIGALMSNWAGMHDMLCTDKQYVACNIQVFLLAFGSLTALTYWTVVNTITCLSLYLRYPVRDTADKYKWFLTAALIYPILSVALVAWRSTKEPGKPAGRTGPFYGTGLTPICFAGIRSARDYFILWSLIFICLGSVMWLLSVGQITRIHIASVRNGTGGIKLRGYVSIILYQLFVVCTAGVFCVTYYVSTRRIPDKLQTEVLNYITGVTDEKPGKPSDFGLVYAQMFLVSFVSLFYALIFGLHPVNWTFIKSLYRKWQLSRSGEVSSEKNDMYEMTVDDRSRF